MKSFLAACSFVVALFVAVSVTAAPSWVATLASGDGGTVVVAQAINRQSVYVLQCDKPACFKTCATSTCAPDCAKDNVLMAQLGNNLTNLDAGAGTTSGINTYPVFSITFESASDSYVNVKPLSTLDPVCRLQLVKRNVPVVNLQ